MESLYIDRRDTRLDVDGGALVVRHPEQARPFSLPLQNIRRVVVSCRLDFSSSVLQALTRAGVAMVILNPKTSDVCTVTLPWTHGHAERRVAQYRMLGDAAGRLIASRNLVAFKIAGQRRTLLRLVRNHPDARRALTLAAGRLADATGACLMSKAGRGQFYPAWEASARVWRRALRRIARQWAREVLAAEQGPA
jgi:CRISPR-associated protein Cas1